MEEIKKYGNKIQHDNFCQKEGHFCKPTNHVSFEKLIENLSKQNIDLITIGYVYLNTRRIFGTTLALAKHSNSSHG